MTAEVLGISETVWQRQISAAVSLLEAKQSSESSSGELSLKFDGSGNGLDSVPQRPRPSKGILV